MNAQTTRHSRFASAVHRGATRQGGDALGWYQYIVEAAAVVWDIFGDSIIDGIDNWIDGCADDNKQKYLKKAREASDEELLAWLKAGGIPGSTGNCRKDGNRYMAREVKRRIEAQGMSVEEAAKQARATPAPSPPAAPAVEDVKAMDTVSAAEARRQAEAIAARSHANQETCRAAVDNYLSSVRTNWRGIANEVKPQCRRFQASTPGCDFPQDVLLIGEGRDGYCVAPLSQQAEMRAVVARLSAQQREQLAALPIGMRAAAVREMLMGGSGNAIGPIDGDGGSVGWGLALLALLGGGLWWFKRKPAKTKDGR